jgi:putative ABC transport system substrate-binding protein
MSKFSKVFLIIVVIFGIFYFAISYFTQSSLSQYAKFGTTPKKIGVIILNMYTDADKSMKDEMSKLGYTDKNLSYDEEIIAPGPTVDVQTAKALARMTGENVDLFFVILESIAKATVLETQKQHINTPIVYITRFDDPVNIGIAKSFKSSGNNATGISTNVPDTIQKYLLFFKEINPNTKKVAVFSDGFILPNRGKKILSELRAQTAKFGITLVEYKTLATSTTDVEKAWFEIAKNIKLGDIDAIYHIPAHIFAAQHQEEEKLAVKLHIPYAVPIEDMPEAGMFSYTDDVKTYGQEAGIMIDKILRGTKPTDIPIQYGTKQLLVLNLKRANEAGIKFSDSMLYKATLKITQ